MADRYFIGATNGLWSVATNWSGSTKPSTGDIVYANGRTVIIDENITVGGITSAAGAGAGSGSFSVSGGTGTIRTLNTNITADTVTCLTTASLASGYTLNINGSVYAVGTTTSIFGIVTGAARVGPMNIVGNIYTYSLSYGINHNATSTASTISITGNVYNYSNGCITIYNQSNGAITINGNVYSLGNTPVSNGVNNTNSVLNIIGDVYGSGGANGSLYQSNVTGGIPTINMTGSPYSNGRVAILIQSGNFNLTSPKGILQSSYFDVTYPLITLQTTGTTSIIGNISGSTSSSPSKGIVIGLNGAGTLNITGNTLVRDNSISATQGLIHITNTSSITNIFGNISGGSTPNTIGVSIGTAGATLNVSGNCVGGSSTTLSPAVFTSQSTGSINITGSCIAGSGYPAIHSVGSGTFINVENGSMVYTNGLNPFYTLGKLQVRSTGQTPIQTITMTDTNNNSRIFLTSFTGNTPPSQVNVKTGTIFSGFSPTTQYTGTCDVPPSSAVTFNTPVGIGYGTESGMTISALTALITSYLQ